jgi:hypothetical protein
MLGTNTVGLGSKASIRSLNLTNEIDIATYLPGFALETTLEKCVKGLVAAFPKTYLDHPRSRRGFIVKVGRNGSSTRLRPHTALSIGVLQ